MDDDFDGYYESITATAGDALKLALRELVDETHTKTTSYDDCVTYVKETDGDLNNSGNIILFYTGQSIDATWDNGRTWNREHVWAQSLAEGWFETSGAGADLHHIRPCNSNVNSSRGNKKFGESTGYYNPVNISAGEDYRGDVARIIFYLMVRYEESDNFEFTDIAESLDMLLIWNEIDPVSQLEINRNNAIENIQGNRNPFIDNEDYASMIWG